MTYFSVSRSASKREPGAVRLECCANEAAGSIRDKRAATHVICATNQPSGRPKPSPKPNFLKVDSGIIPPSKQWFFRRDTRPARVFVGSSCDLLDEDQGALVVQARYLHVDDAAAQSA